MMASLRRDRRGVSSLISAARTTAGLAVVSLTGATVASAFPWFLVVPFLVVVAFLFVVVRFLACASAALAMQEKTTARRHNLIKCCFISLSLNINVSERSVRLHSSGGLIWKLFQVEHHRRQFTDLSVLTFYPNIIKEDVRAGSCFADDGSRLSTPAGAFVSSLSILGDTTTNCGQLVAYDEEG